MLKRLKLLNFRNHADFSVELDQTTVFVGANGAGKSNILEAIALLSFCRSFRDDDKKNLVKLNADFARISGDEAEIFIQRNPSFIFQAKEKGVVKKQSDFIGRLRSVVFSPETMEIITGSPRSRRKFLDILISQSDRHYLQTLVRYEKVRVERNSLLQRIRQGLAGDSELDFWDKELVTEGKTIIKSRTKTIKYLNTHLSDLYSKISGRTDRLDLDYNSNAIDCRAHVFTSPNLSLQRRGTDGSQQHHNECDDFAEKLKSMRRREIPAGRTLIGPHRDDLTFNLNLCNMANFASRGEIRSAILALKIAELEFLSDGEKNQPLLLLDDIFSEFDRSRREHLCNLIEEYQTVITTTEVEHLSKCLLGKSKIIELKQPDNFVCHSRGGGNLGETSNT